VGDRPLLQQTSLLVLLVVVPVTSATGVSSRTSPPAAGQHAGWVRTGSFGPTEYDRFVGNPGEKCRSNRGCAGRVCGAPASMSTTSCTWRRYVSRARPSL
jgi:hypothetical protein